MYHHVEKLIFTVRVDEPDRRGPSLIDSANHRPQADLNYTAGRHQWKVAGPAAAAWPTKLASRRRRYGTAISAWAARPFLIQVPR
jgi:hypothetical protein